MRNKNRLSIYILTLVLILSLMPNSLAKAVSGEMKTITTKENIQVVPIKALTEKMGGKVIENKEKGYTDFVLSNGKTLRVDPKIPVAMVDGKTAPYRTVDVNGIIFPEFYTPVLENGDYLIPTYVLQKYCGIEIKDDLLIFEIKQKEDSDKVKVIVQKPIDTSKGNGSGTKGNDSKVIDSDKGKDLPLKPNTPNTKPSNTPPKTNTPVVKTPTQNTSTAKYTGATVAGKLSALGWTAWSGAYEWNKYGANGSGYGRYGTFSSPSGTVSKDVDMVIGISGYSKEFATALNKTFKLILPTKGDYLFNYLNTTDIKGGETFNLDGRKVWFNLYETGTMTISFGPMK